MKRITVYIGKQRKGQLLLEVVIAMGILVLFVTAFISFILGAYDGGTKSREWTEATHLARQGIEQVRSIAQRDFSLLHDGTYGVTEWNNIYILTGSNTLHNAYTRDIGIHSVHRNAQGDIVTFGGEEDPRTKEVTSTVSWGSRSLTLTTILSDWRRPRWKFNLLTQGGSGSLHATIPTASGGIAFHPKGDLSLPHVFYEEDVFGGAVVRDLEVDAHADRLYVLSQENDTGPEFAAIDLANVSNQDLTYINGTELGTDGVKFILQNDTAYILTAHGDRDIIKVNLSTFKTEATWDILRAAKPIDMAIDSATGRAFVLTNRAEQGKSVSGLPPEIVHTGLFVDTAHAQGAPTCNGLTATIYVDGSNNIVSTVAKDNGDPYTGTLTGSNGDDVIVGTSGVDDISGRNGNDTICGGDGADIIDGGNNNDTIFGEGGADEIDAGNGTNTVCGGADGDDITGGNSADSLAGGAGTDTIDGGGGTDICREGESNSNCEDDYSAIATCGVTGDTTAPTVSTLSPADDSTDIDPTANLVITFSEVVNVESGNISIYKSDDTLFAAIDVTSGQVTGDGTTSITINPTSDLDFSTSYYVQIASTTFDDPAGNSYAGIANKTSWTFTTVANCTPDPLPTCNGQTATVYVDNCNNMVGGTDSGDPYDGTINGSQSIDDVIVGTDGADTIDGKSGNDTICGGAGNDDITAGAGADIVFGEAGNDTISGEGDDDTLCGGADNDTITGAGGNDLLDGGDGTDDLNGTGRTDTCRRGETYTNCEDFSSAITTCGVAADTTAPTVSTLSPTDNATGIDPDTNLVITFSEEISVESGNISIYRSSNDTLIEEIDVTSGQVTGDGTTSITINPSVTLLTGTEYYIQIDGTAFDDLAANSYAGIADTTTWSFTTSGDAPDETAPSVNTFSPADDSSDVSLTTNFVLTFDESVTIVSGNIAIYLSDGTLHEAINVTSDQVTGSGTNTITINPSIDLDGGSGYYILIDATAFDDLSGNGFAGISDTTTWNITATAPASSSSSSSATSTGSSVASSAASSGSVASSSSVAAGRAKLPPPSEKLYVIDLSSSAESTADIEDATIVKEVDIGSARRIEIASGYAYILTDNTAAELSVMNLATYEVTKCDLPGDQLPNDLLIDGTTLYITRNSGVYEEFIGYEIDPLNPESCDHLLTHTTVRVELSDDGRAFTLLPNGEFAFVLAGFGLSNFHIIDLQSKTNTPLKPFSSVDGLCNISDTVGSYIFTGCRGDGSVTVFEGREDRSNYFLWGTYTSPAFDASAYAKAIRGIEWQTAGDGDIFLRIRSAATKEALQTAPWIGPDGTAATFFDHPKGQTLSLPQTGGNQFVQWKAYFRKTGTDTPVLKNVILSFE